MKKQDIKRTMVWLSPELHERIQTFRAKHPELKYSELLRQWISAGLENEIARREPK